MGKNFKFDWSKVKENIQNESKGKQSYEDNRFWKPSKDSEGKYNSLSIIRFLPDQEGTPFVKYYSHSFDYMTDGQKKFWIKNCINTFGYDQECPVCKKNTEYWNSSFESDKELARKRGRKVNYVANILVIKNPNKPEDEGKVFLYRFGQKVYDKIKQKMFPSETDLEDPDFVSFVPFDLYEGADFKLKTVPQGEFPNYDQSSFSLQKPLGDEKKIEKIMEMTYSLEEFTDIKNYPTNEETIRALGDLLGISEVKDKPKKESKKKEDVLDEEIEEVSDTTLPFNVDEEDDEKSSDIDEDEEFFRNLK